MKNLQTRVFSRKLQAIQIFEAQSPSFLCFKFLSQVSTWDQFSTYGEKQDLANTDLHFMITVQVLRIHRLSLRKKSSKTFFVLI